MMYVNGAPLTAKISRASMTSPGQFFVDESAGQIYLRLPSGVAFPAMVEVAIRQKLLNIESRSNITLRNFAMMRNRGWLQQGLAGVIYGNNIVLDGMQVRHAAYTGWGSAYSKNVVVRNSQFIDNGVNGLGAFR